MLMHNVGDDDDDNDINIIFEPYIRKIYAQHHVILIHAVRCGLANVPFSNLLQIFKIKGICTGLYIHILLVVWWRHIYSMPQSHTHTHKRPYSRKYIMGEYLCTFRLRYILLMMVVVLLMMMIYVPIQQSTVYTMAYYILYCSIDYLFRNVTWLIWGSHYAKFILVHVVVARTRWQTHTYRAYHVDAIYSLSLSLMTPDPKHIHLWLWTLFHLWQAYIRCSRYTVAQFLVINECKVAGCIRVGAEWMPCGRLKPKYRQVAPRWKWYPINAHTNYMFQSNSEWQQCDGAQHRCSMKIYKPIILNRHNYNEWIWIYLRVNVAPKMVINHGAFTFYHHRYRLSPIMHCVLKREVINYGASV